MPASDLQSDRFIRLYREKRTFLSEVGRTKHPDMDSDGDGTQRRDQAANEISQQR